MDETTVRFNNRLVPLSVDSAGTLKQGSVGEIAALVVQAIIEGAHLPVAAAVKSLIVVATATAFEINVELQDLKVRRLIALRDVTARRYSNALISLANDNSWDAEVKEMHREVLLCDLKSEIQRRNF